MDFSWVTKIIERISLYRLSTIVLIAVAELILFWKVAESYLEEAGIPDSLVIGIICLVAISLAYLLVEVAMQLITFLKKQVVKIWNLVIKRVTLKSRAQKTIFSLPSEGFKVLAELSENGCQEFKVTSGIKALELAGFIEKIQATSQYCAIYEINKIVDSEFQNLIKKQWRLDVEQVLMDIDEDIKRALELFFVDKIDYVSSDCKPLPNSLYSGLRTLSQKNVLCHQEKDSLDIFCLQEVVIDLVENKFSTKVVRTEINLSHNCIQGNMSSGGGAIGSYI